MFKLPNPPSPQAEAHEVADFMELVCWDRGSASRREIVACLGRLDDNESNDGCDDDEDENSDFLDEVMNEIERRAVACGSGYPFLLDLEGTVIRHDDKGPSPRAILYRYLLLSTRLNMKDHRVHADLDGTMLLEEVTAHALKNYLGPNRAKSLVFGTASPGTFKDKVDHLCKELREGEGFGNLDDVPPTANDGKLDAVAWIPFSDQQPGQLIIFGQCKAGSTWKELVSQLRPDAFIKKWFKGKIVVDPMRIFCVSEAADRARWKSTCVDAGVLLDRCRLVDFSDNLPSDLLDKIARWSVEAKKTVTYPAS